MKRTLLWLVILSVPIRVLALPKIAVLDIIVPAETDQSIVVPATESIMEELVMSKFFTVLDRTYVDQVLKEMQFQNSGMVNDSQVAEVGNYLGADFVVTGKAQNVTGTWFLVSKMIEVKTGVITIQASEHAQGQIIELINLAHTVGKKIAAGGVSSPDAPKTASSRTKEPSQAAVPAPASAAAGEKLSVGFIYTGGPNGSKFNERPLPAEAARMRLQEKFGDRIATTTMEGIQPSTYSVALDRLVERGCRLIITPDRGLFEGEAGTALARAAERNPNVYFEGYRTAPPGKPNVGYYFTKDDSRLWYLTGLAAGALTKSGKIGVIWYENEVGRRLVNLFALGVKTTNPQATVAYKYVPPELYHDGSKSRSMVMDLVREGCDVFGPTDVIPMLEAIRNASTPAKKLYTFSTMFPWESWGETCAIGPWYDWSVAYERIVADVLNGAWKNDTLELGMADGAVKLGGMGEPFNPAVVPLLEKRVQTPDSGELTVIDLILRRYDQMKENAFEPFVGPLKDQSGNVRLQEGERIDSARKGPMPWLLENVRSVR